MRLRLRALFLALMIICFWTSSAAAAPKTFTILPFTVNGPSNYKYLEREIPNMLSSRLNWKGQFEPAKDAAGAKRTAPASEAEADTARIAAKADYVLWGTMSMMGERCSIDMRVRDSSGNTRPIARESNVANFFTDLRQMADSITAEIFPRQTTAAAPQQQAARPQMNPEIIRNQTTPETTYMNPQIRYSGGNADESRLRSQTLPFACVGMEIVDGDGDGRKEVFLLADHKLYVYHFKDQAALTDKPVTEFNFGKGRQTLSIRSIDIDLTGKPKIIVNTKSDDDKDLYGHVFSFDGKSLKEEVRAIGFYINVVNLPPLFRPQLIGQLHNPPHLFRPGIFDVTIQKGKLIPGNRIFMPKGCNVFNFTHIPAGSGRDDTQKILMLTEDEKLVLMSEKGVQLFASEEKYSGAVQGIYVDESMPGTGRTTTVIGQTYYVPMRMLSVDLDGDGKHEVLVNKPISTAGVIFSGYRSFPQSEIHSLQWDGLGLSLLWKTRRIRGSVADYAITDANQDGALDLVVLVNTYSGALGVAARKSMIISYPLDLSKTAPNTPATFQE